MNVSNASASFKSSIFTLKSPVHIVALVVYTFLTQDIGQKQIR